LHQLTMAPRPDVTKSPTKFGFRGGNLSDFIDSIRVQFGVDLTKIGTVPESMLYTVHVPKMQMGDGQGVLRYQTVLALYNEVSDDPNVGMGRWIMKGWKPGTPHPDVLLLVPARRAEGATYNVRAFAFLTEGNATDEKLDAIRKVIREQQQMITSLAGSEVWKGLAPEDVQGDFFYHRSTGIIVVGGGKVYVEMASAIIEAAKEGLRNADIVIPNKQSADERK
jgi:hypothetical protein